MSAVLKGEARHPEAPLIDVLRAEDLDAVIAIENAVYTHPWTRGNFADSLGAGYLCRALRIDGRLQGYSILIVAVGEAHLLNLSIADSVQRRGLGSTLLREVMRIAREHQAQHLFLEVRPSNAPAQALYAKFGFRNIGLRRGYYPAQGGREDAIVLSREL